MTALPGFFQRIDHPSLASTNDEVLRLARAGAGEGMLVTAGRQIGGRGRRGRQWHSPAGNLYASFLLHPGRPLAEAALLSFVAALAVIGAVDRWCPATDSELSWPNDVHVRGAKISGILLESVALGPDPGIVVGIGVNVAHHPDLAERATTSLHALGHTEADRETVLGDVASGLLLWYERWREAGFGPVREAWLARARGIGGGIVARVGQGERRGTFTDLDENGALVLVTAEGAAHRVTAGDVFFEVA